MSAALGWLIAAVDAVLLLCFAAYLRGLLAMPSGHRPRVERRDRLGRPLPPGESPNHENPGAGGKSRD